MLIRIQTHRTMPSAPHIRYVPAHNDAIIPAFNKTDKPLTKGAYLRQLLTDKKGNLAKRVHLNNGEVWRPQLDEEGSSFVAKVLEPETGGNFTGIVALTMKPDPRGIGLLNDEFEAHIV